MSRESECNYGAYEEDYMMSHMYYDATNFEDMGDYYDYYTDNDHHDMMDHHQDFRYNYSDYDSDYSSVHDKERYHDVEQPSSNCIDSKYVRIYHDSDYTSSNDNEAQVSSHASSHGTNFDHNNDLVEPYIDEDCSSFTDMENYYDYNSKYSGENFGSTMVKSDTTKRHGTTYFYSSSSRLSNKKATMHSSYGAPSTSRRRHEKNIAKSATLRHATSTTRRRHNKCIE